VNGRSVSNSSQLVAYEHVLSLRQNRSSAQSLGFAQLFVSEQPFGQSPPQSTSVSLPFFFPSVHVCAIVPEDEELDEDVELEDVELDDVELDDVELDDELELLLVDDSPDDELSPDDWPPEALPELLLTEPLDDELAFVSVPAEGNSMPQATAPTRKVQPATRPTRKERLRILHSYQISNDLPAFTLRSYALWNDPNHARHRTRVRAAGVSVGAFLVELRRNHFLLGIEAKEGSVAVLHHVVVNEQVTRAIPIPRERLALLNLGTALRFKLELLVVPNHRTVGIFGC
jgi:hypothetical protein